MVCSAESRSANLRRDDISAESWDPTASEFAEAMRTALEEAKVSMGRVNVAIFGRTGVGKSTLINAFFGEKVARTGIGKPVTEKMDYYEHPNGILGIYDSQGFETGQSGDALLKVMRALVEERRKKALSEQIHVVWYCVQASDLRFEDSQAEFVRALAALGLPVLAVMTQVEHDRHDVTHPESVEFAEYIQSLDLPLSPNNHVVHTNAMEDSHARNPTPVHGLGDLLDATIEVVPEAVRQALIAAQVHDKERKSKSSRQVVVGASVLAGAAATAPIPLADSAMIVPIQVLMMARVATLWDMPVGAQSLTGLATSAFFGQGMAFVGRAAVRSLLKLIPGANIAAGVISAGVAATLTLAVGEAWIAVCLHLSGKDQSAIMAAIDSPELRRIFMEAFKQQVRHPKNRKPLEG